MKNTQAKYRSDKVVHIRQLDSKLIALPETNKINMGINKCIK